jgi:hypothetical protein
MRLHGLKICGSISDNPAHTIEPGRRAGDMVVLTHGGVDAVGEKPLINCFLEKVIRVAEYKP